MLYTFKKADDASMEAIAEEKKVRKTEEIFLLFSLGSQFDHLIKQELEKLGVFCLVADPASVTVEDVKKVKPIGIILSGGPVSVYDTPPPFDAQIFDLEIPVLGICLGFQLWAQHLGIEVVSSDKREFGTHYLDIQKANILLSDCTHGCKVLQSHGDKILADSRLEIIASTENAPVAVAKFNHLYGVQFHPEVTESEEGYKVFSNFCFKICQAKDKFPASRVAERKVKELQEKIGRQKVLLALSGGSDSSTVAFLLKQALGENNQQLKAVYIKGIDRPDDEEFVQKYFANQNWLELEIVEATEQFLKVLKGKVSMREKRLAMISVYDQILKSKADEFGAAFIAQGTLYTDVSESGGGYQSKAKKATIKIHHNTNNNFGYPEITPLIDCVKDSGRQIGREVSTPEELLIRHPFPGPGLVVRIEGEINQQKLKIARQADNIYIEELRKWELYEKIWQAGAVVTKSVTTCTKGDDAAEGFIIAIWAVYSVNGFTARAAELPYDFLKVVSRRLTNEIREVGAVVYRISDKPPATIEWG